MKLFTLWVFKLCLLAVIAGVGLSVCKPEPPARPPVTGFPKVCKPLDNCQEADCKKTYIFEKVPESLGGGGFVPYFKNNRLVRC